MITIDDMTTNVIAFNDSENSIVMKSVPEKDCVWVSVIAKADSNKLKHEDVLVPVKTLRAMLNFVTTI